MKSKRKPLFKLLLLHLFRPSFSTGEVILGAKEVTCDIRDVKVVKWCVGVSKLYAGVIKGCAGVAKWYARVVESNAKVVLWGVRQVP